ncbi:hypothetical protein Q8A67_014879 [Cirrhinus molitorella]|uniref:Uncharacterized protein n=1 Tax=Cirrhinus molitorella TaxID=172907 RepID=A0AA88PPD7_9TELE|nr:hypothetical protein Q8A67_014879 [Cirrhinus molitorella]
MTHSLGLCGSATNPLIIKHRVLHFPGLPLQKEFSAASGWTTSGAAVETGCMIEKHVSRCMHSQVRYEVTSPDFISPEKLLKQWKELLLGTLRPSALGDPGQLLKDWGEHSTSTAAVPDSVSQSTAYTAKTFLCALLPQMGRVVFWVRGSVAQDRTPPEELNGLYETENSVVWLALCIGSFQSDGCRVLSTSLEQDSRGTGAKRRQSLAQLEWEQSSPEARPLMASEGLRNRPCVGSNTIVQENLCHQ